MDRQTFNSIGEKIPESLTVRIMNLFQGKNSLHASQILLHYSGIRHKLNYPDYADLTNCLKLLVKQKRLYRRVYTGIYRTSIFSLVKFEISHAAKYNFAVQKSITNENHRKGKNLTILMKRIISKFSKNVKNKFQYPPDKRHHIDVFSNDFAMECKNHDRTIPVGEREVDKFVKTKALFSKTILTTNRQFYFIASALTNSAKKLLQYHHIRFIEIGFQIMKWSDRSAYSRLFDLITPIMPKTYPNTIDDRIFEISLTNFIYNPLRFGTSKDKRNWELSILNVPDRWRRKQFLEDSAC